MDSINGFLGMLITSLLWGITDPLLKKFGADQPVLEQQNQVRFGVINRFFGELLCYLTNWKYLATFSANLIGGLTFLWTLNHCDLSSAVPVTNSLKFLFTFLTGHFFLAENYQLARVKTVLGLILILTGIGLQFWAKHG